MTATGVQESRTDLCVQIANLQHRYRKRMALDAIELTVAVGHSLAIVGPDGVGKSSLLALIAGAKRVQQGHLRTLDADMQRRRARERVLPRIAYMPQGLGRNLYPNLTVRENVGFFARLFDVPAANAVIDQLLQATGLAPFGDRLMRKLSGGMKQKLGLCCALVHTPDLLILDEPTTGIDPLSRREFWELVDAIRDAHPQLTLLVATADMSEAARFERVLMMDGGRILAAGTPQQLLARTGTGALDDAYISLLPPQRRDGESGTANALPPLQENADIAIESRRLTRRFDDFVAVDNVTFSIRRGEIFGFLGSNGCGKTTTMKMLTGLLPASAGEVLLFGRLLDAKDIETRKRVGYMSQNFSLYGELTVRQNLRLHARLFNLGDTPASKRIGELCASFELNDVLDQRADLLPLGVRQRLSLAVAILHQPEVLILDEPTSGVDPIARNRFWNDLRKLAREQGVTIFISTHFMAEAINCDRIAFMHAGRVIATGTPDNLQRAQNAASLEDAFVAYMEQGGRKAVTHTLSLPAANERNAGNRIFSLRRFRAYAWREAIELMRDRVRLVFSLLGTAILMLIFGFGITLDVDNLRFAVLDRDQTPESRAYIDQFAHSPYFLQRSSLRNDDEAIRRLRSNDIVLFLDIPPHFGADIRRGKTTDVAITVDGAMPFRAETVLGYVQGVNQSVMTEYAARAGRDVQPAASVEMRYRYNQAFRSIDAMVPAVIALMLAFLPPILTALGVVTEKELGSITNLYVTPVTRLEFLLGKQMPYVALALFNFMVMMVLAVLVFGVVPKGSVAGLIIAATAYVLATTAIGLVTSTLTRTQVAALFGTALVSIIPAVQFTGFLQPVATAEGLPRLIGTFFPTTYFLRACVGAFAKSLSFLDIMPFALILLLFWPVLMTVAHALLPRQEA
jgi:ribosome-dependent ATPase